MQYGILSRDSVLKQAIFTTFLLATKDDHLLLVLQRQIIQEAWRVVSNRAQ